MNSHQQKVIQAVARHFGIPRKIYTPVVDQSLCDNNQVYFELERLEYLPAGIKFLKIYSSKEKEVSINKLWNADKLKQTLLYSNFFDMSNNIQDNMLFCYIHGSDVFVMYEDKSYAGVGGIFVKEQADSRTGIVIEPLKNYLQSNYPVEQNL
jgi:hypothetical protein